MSLLNYFVSKPPAAHFPSSSMNKEKVSSPSNFAASEPPVKKQKLIGRATHHTIKQHLNQQVARSTRLWKRLDTLSSVEALKCRKLLDATFPLGFHPSNLPAHYQKHIVRVVVQAKLAYPDAIVLVRNGLFFNGCGIDAVICMEHCPLMSRQNTPNIGARVASIQQLLHQLLAQDLQIILVEKDEFKHYQMQLVDKFHPIYFGSEDQLPTLDAAIPVHIAIVLDLDSVDISVINDIEQTIDIYQSIHLTTLPLIVAMYPAKQLYLMGSATSLAFTGLEFIQLSWSCGKTAFLQHFLEHHLHSTLTYQHVKHSSIVQRCTIAQLGLLPESSVRGVASLLDAICPNVGKRCRHLVSKQLICPPDCRVSEIFRTLVCKYTKIQTALPRPPSKILSLHSTILMLRKAKASAAHVRVVYHHLKWVCQIGRYVSKLASGETLSGTELIAVASMLSQIKGECLLDKVKLSCEMIEQLIGIGKDMSSSASYIVFDTMTSKSEENTKIEAVMVETCEKWHSKVSVIASATFNERVRKRRHNYIEASPLLSLWCPEIQQLVSKRKEGTGQIAVDKKGNPLKGNFRNCYTLPSLATLHRQYRISCEEAQIQADAILQQVNVDLSEKVVTFAESVWCWHRIIQAHVSTNLAKTWCVAEIVNNAKPVLRLTDYRPFWMTSDAVSNDLNLTVMTVLTGGNMGGKSTVCRAVAGIALLAKAGYLVPSSSCSVSQNLNIFLNVGNADCMLTNLSGFGAEAADMASLFQMTAKHQHVLAICDEIAAGTSELEGSAIATAYITALFKTHTIGFCSTHFEKVLTARELTNLPKMQMERVNHRFTYKMKPGVCEYRYATETARKVGVPLLICEHAERLIAAATSTVAATLAQQTSIEAGKLVNALDIVVELLGESALTLEGGQQCPAFASSCLYLLKCQGNFCYVGETDNLEQRFRTHFAGAKKPVSMHVWKMESKSKARQVESEVTHLLQRNEIALLSSSDGNHSHFGSC